MKSIQKSAIRVLYICLLAAMLLLPAFAGDQSPELFVETTEVGGEAMPMTVADGLYAEAEVVEMTISQAGIDFIVSYEGFSANPLWDVSRYSIGYGNSYEACKELFGDDCAPITEEQAMELFRSEMVGCEAYMNSFFAKNGIVLNQNQFDALMSFTYNVGIGWTTYKNDDGTWCKLKALLLSGPDYWTEDACQEAFGTWVKAGGQVLPGLVKRRAAEATMFVTPCGDTVPDVDTDTGSDTGTDTDTDTDADTDADAAPEKSFADVSEDDWFYADVMEAYSLGLVSGTGSNSFEPEGVLTRAQLVKLLANFHGVGDLEDDVETRFFDVEPGMWYTAEIAWAAEKGYVLGCDDGGFHPEDPITREQLCTILARYMQDQGYTAGTAADLFQDDSEISDYAKDGVYFCTSLGIVNGVPGVGFAPRNGASRAEAAVVMLRAYRTELA